MHWDPAVEKALCRELGHDLPARDGALEAIEELHIAEARELSTLPALPSLSRLMLVGCDPVDLSVLPDLPALRSLTVRDCGLRNLLGVERFSRLLRLEMPRGFVEDLAPLLSLPRLVGLDVTGNPLSETSYREVLPQLCRRIRSVRHCAEREWQLNLRLHRAGLPVSCYVTEAGLRLCRPGLSVTDSPAWAHPVVSFQDVESRLAQDPGLVMSLFDRDEFLPNGGRVI